MKDKKERKLHQLVTQLAKSYSLDLDSAEAFLVGVQSHFVLNKPSFKIIMGILTEENLKALPSMLRMAELVREKWDRNPAKSKKYKISKDLSKPTLQPTKRDRYDLLGGTSANFDEHEERDHDRPKVVRRTKNDYERVSPSKLRHCPHGVHIGKICAICEPDKFREATGED
jgi:hypothetical protein